MALRLVRSGDHDGAEAQLREIKRKLTDTVRISIQPRVLYYDPVTDRTKYTWWRSVNWTWDMEPSDIPLFRMLLADFFSRVEKYGPKEVRDRLTIALPLRLR